MSTESLRGSVLLAAAVARLREAGVPDPARDARLLLAHAVRQPTARLTLILPEPVEAEAAARFEALLTRRAGREPVSHLLGRRSFYGRDFSVSRDVLDPRPETETLIEAALAQSFASVLDLGTGSGCILLTILSEKPHAVGLGTDLSEPALDVARDNARALGVKDRSAFRRGSWYGAVPQGERFDLIVSNPPYIAPDEMPGLAPEVRNHEPRMALTDEVDGLSAYRMIAAGAQEWLEPGGVLIVEIGQTQGAPVAELMTEEGLLRPRVLQDMDGRDRVVLAHAPL